ncbi:translation protein SH3-like domain-containing protein [Mycotypha africana]|uniref:translation protein SH3-like domain-containing protein n=1 Tax=Mycotypha africana TaxID=64632 RepID=UPI002300981C|nr:translation protein SH3-like domain-containing protein [Mycotypha africana]KAI8990995.1 translation protein SH3-like domain-containing protein [Mycotypha africana]
MLRLGRTALWHTTKVPTTTALTKNLLQPSSLWTRPSTTATTATTTMDSLTQRMSQLRFYSSKTPKNPSTAETAAKANAKSDTTTPTPSFISGFNTKGSAFTTIEASAYPSQQFKTKKPTTPGKRWLRRVPRDHLYKGKAVRSLTVAKRSSGGRNNSGHITVRHRGGGHKRRIRIIDWHRREPGTHNVMRLEYDPGRTAWIALLKHEETGKLSYIVAPQGVKTGDKLISYRSLNTKTTTTTTTTATTVPLSSTATTAAPSSSTITTTTTTTSTTVAPTETLSHSVDTIKYNVGNCFPIKMIPVGSIIHSIGLKRNGPGIMARAAGTYGQLIQTAETGYAQVRLSSGEVRLVPVDACATLGAVSNPDHQHEWLGKAGRRRWMGFRPSVRGVAMNAVDHPHGGGRGKSKGNKDPRSPWGVLAKGGKTRKSPNPFVVKPRPRR